MTAWEGRRAVGVNISSMFKLASSPGSFSLSTYEKEPGYEAILK